MTEIAIEPQVDQTQTKLQAEMVAKTTAAVQDTGFGKDFDLEVEAAIAKDTNAPAPTAKPESAKSAVKEAPKPDKPSAPGLEIPDVLLGKTNKAAETKPEETTEVEREKFIKEQTAGMSPKAADRFRAIEKSKYEWEQKAVKAEKREKELMLAQEQLKASANPSEAEALKKQIEELDAIVQKSALADHPRFKAHFDNAIAEEVGTASKLVPKEVSAEVQALLALPETAQRNRRLNEIAAELEPLEASKFHQAVNNSDRLSEKKAGELANWKTNKVKLQEISQAEQRQTAEQQKAAIDTALKTVLPRFTSDENGVELFRKVEGNEDWNKGVDERIANVRKITESNLSKEDIAEMAGWAMGGAQYRKMFLTQRVLVQKLQEEIAALKGGEPGLGDGGLAVTDDEEKGGMLDTVTRIAQKMGAVR